MGKSFLGKFSASLAIMRLNAFCQGTEGIYLQVMRNTLDCRLHPLGFEGKAAQGPEAVPIQRVKAPWGCPGTATSSPENAHKEGCVRVKVSAKVRTVWRRFQFQDLTWLLLHLIMQCPVAAISLSRKYHYYTKKKKNP